MTPQYLFASSLAPGAEPPPEPGEAQSYAILPGLACLTYGRRGVSYYLDVLVYGLYQHGKTAFIHAVMRQLSPRILPDDSWSEREKDFFNEADKYVWGDGRPDATGEVKHYFCHWHLKRWQALRELPSLFGHCMLLFLFLNLFFMAYFLLAPDNAILLGLATAVGCLLWSALLIAKEVRNVAGLVEVVLWDVPGEFVWASDEGNDRSQKDAQEQDREIKDQISEEGDVRPQKDAARDRLKGGPALKNFLLHLVRRREEIHREAYGYAPVVICNPLKLWTQEDATETEAMFKNSDFCRILSHAYSLAKDMRCSIPPLVVINYQRTIETLVDQEHDPTVHVRTFRAQQTAGRVHVPLLRSLDDYIAGAVYGRCMIFRYDAAELIGAPRRDTEENGLVWEFAYGRPRAEGFEDEGAAELRGWLNAAVWERRRTLASGMPNRREARPLNRWRVRPHNLGPASSQTPANEDP